MNIWSVKNEPSKNIGQNTKHANGNNSIMFFTVSQILMNMPITNVNSNNGNMHAVSIVLLIHLFMFFFCFYVFVYVIEYATTA